LAALHAPLHHRPKIAALLNARLIALLASGPIGVYVTQRVAAVTKLPLGKSQPQLSLVGLPAPRLARISPATPTLALLIALWVRGVIGMLATQLVEVATKLGPAPSNWIPLLVERSALPPLTNKFATLFLAQLIAL
jgi:hypothetical protein